MDVSTLVGKTLTRCERMDINGNDALVFVADDEAWALVHSQDCCEFVRIEDIWGDLSDLVGAPLVLAEEVSNYGGPALDDRESYTWTFYRFATANGDVSVRFLGESNGYYSESVGFESVQVPR